MPTALRVRGPTNRLRRAHVRGITSPCSRRPRPPGSCLATSQSELGVHRGWAAVPARSWSHRSPASADGPCITLPEERLSLASAADSRGQGDVIGGGGPGQRPQKSHKCAARGCPTGSPRTRRHSAAHPGIPVTIEARTHSEQAKRPVRHAASDPDEVVRGGVEPPTFRFSGGRSYQLSYLTLAVLTGFEPATSTLTGWRALLAALQDHLLPPTLADDAPRRGGAPGTPCARKSISPEHS